MLTYVVLLSVLLPGLITSGCLRVMLVVDCLRLYAFCLVFVLYVATAWR